MVGDGHGTPIRLLFDSSLSLSQAFNSGNTVPSMELMALSIALSVERTVGGSPMPFTGGRRFGIDLNLANTTIIIEGIFTDDDVGRRVISGTPASAFIDCAISQFIASGNTTKTFLVGAEYAKLVGKLIITQRTSDVLSQDKTIEFIKGGVAGTVLPGAIPTIDVGGPPTGVWITPTLLATAIVSALGPAHLNTSFTVAAVTSDMLPLSGATKVSITQPSNGSIFVSPSIRFENSNAFSLYHKDFVGGTQASTVDSKSAGDKVQDIFGILQNTSPPGSIITAAAAGLLMSGFTFGLGAVAGAAITAAAVLSVDGDYPIGLQIPYNSMIQAPDGNKYTMRNFLIPTGLLKTSKKKMSDENTQPASVDFNAWDNTTGIQGAVQKFDIGYNAGENLYTYQMVFAPIDILM